MNFRIRQPLKRTLLFVAFVAFACRLVIPPGFMPAGLDEGGPVVFCPVGLPDGFGPSAHHNHGDGEDGKVAELAWERCAFGAVFDAEALVVNVDLQIPTLGDDTPSMWQQSLFVSSVPPAYRSRAPPALDS